jgi:hypothetical protein
MINKFNARKVEYQGMTFDSKKEFHRYLELKDMEKQGEIEQLTRQGYYPLLSKNKYFREVVYYVDFIYKKDGEWIYEDVKGLRKGSAYQLFKIKQKFMYDKYKILVKEI